MASDPEFSKPRTIVIFVVAFALLGLAAWQTIEFLKPQLAKRYINRGTTYLQSQNYDAALTEFTKAEKAHSPEAANWIDLTLKAKTDPKILESYWEQWHIDSVTRLISEASGPFNTPKEALTEGIKLYATSNAPYAQYAVDEALKLDPAYREAFQYRYLVYTELAKENKKYRDLAVEARKKRDSLTSLYLNP
jgi:Tfp pilus assembly protein PilF